MATHFGHNTQASAMGKPSANSFGKSCKRQHQSIVPYSANVASRCLKFGETFHAFCALWSEDLTPHCRACSVPLGRYGVERGDVSSCDWFQMVGYRVDSDSGRVEYEADQQDVRLLANV